MSYFDEASLVMIPSGYKNQKVYSVKPLDGSGDLTFSRASSATRVASNGLIEKVRTNLVLQSETFDNASWIKGDLSVSANTIANPLNGATTADTIVEAATTGQHYLFQSPSLTGVFTYSIYAKAKERSHIVIGGAINPTNFYSVLFNLTSGTVQQANNGSSTGITASIVSAGNGWYRCSVALSSAVAIPYAIWTSDGTTLAPTYYEPSYTGNGTSGLYIFGAQVETGDIATDYIATTSAAVSVGPVSGLPRLDYLNSTCPRLLLEPQRTNLSIYSEQIDNAGWGKSQSGTGLVPVVTANNAISPDGYQNADTIVFDAGAGTTASDISAIFQTFGGTTATYTASFYAKTASGTAQIQVRIDGSNYDKFTITNQWQRFTLTKALTGTSNGFEMAIRRGLNEPMNASATIQLWGVQVELGAYATSYIPTLGTSVTRVADACSKTGISSLIGQTEGTGYVEFDFNGKYSASGVIALHLAGNAGKNIYFGVGTNNEFFYEVQDTSYVVSITGFFTTQGTKKVAFAYKENDFVLYINGVQIGTDTSGTVPALSEVYLGALKANSNYNLSSTISQALVFKTRLTNAQLAELTTL